MQQPIMRAFQWRRNPDGSTFISESRFNQDEKIGLIDVLRDGRSVFVLTSREEYLQRRIAARQPMPADWRPNARHLEIANQRALDCEEEAKAFRLRSKGAQRVSWDLAFEAHLRARRGTRS